ncbi:MAG: Rho termination factor N-terminal domain-containing protein, partial [Alphaproteobacteria bacterium]
MARESTSEQARNPKDKPTAGKGRARGDEPAPEAASAPTAAAAGLPAGDEDEEEVSISSSVPPIDLRELKRKQIHDLAQMARELAVDGSSTMRKQELIFGILQAQTA